MLLYSLWSHLSPILRIPKHHESLNKVVLPRHQRWDSWVGSKCTYLGRGCQGFLSSGRHQSLILIASWYYCSLSYLYTNKCALTYCWEATWMSEKRKIGRCSCTSDQGWLLWGGLALKCPRIARCQLSDRQCQPFMWQKYMCVRRHWHLEAS